MRIALVLLPFAFGCVAEPQEVVAPQPQHETRDELGPVSTSPTESTLFRGCLVEQLNGAGVLEEWTDAMGHVRERRTPAGIEYFHWDPLGRIVHRFGAEELWFDYPPGQMIVRRPSGAMVWRFDLDDRGRRTKRWGDPYDHDVWEQSTFDERGQLTHFETLGDTFTFTYDGGRVVESVIDTAYRPKCTMRIAYRGDDHVSFVDATPERGAPSHCRYAFDDQSRLTRATCTRGVTSVTVAWTYEGEWVIASGVAGHMERHHRSCAYPPRSIEGIVQPEVYGIEPRAIDSVGPMVRVPAPSVVCTE